MRNYSLAVIEHFLKNGMVRVERSRRKKQIVKAQFVAMDTGRMSRRPGGRPSSYSFPCGNQDWMHKPLPGVRQIEPLFGELAPGESPAPFQRAIFAAVPLSVARETR